MPFSLHLAGIARIAYMMRIQSRYFVELYFVILIANRSAKILLDRFEAHGVPPIFAEEKR